MCRNHSLAERLPPKLIWLQPRIHLRGVVRAATTSQFTISFAIFSCIHRLTDEDEMEDYFSTAWAWREYKEDSHAWISSASWAWCTHVLRSAHARKMLWTLLYRFRASIEEAMTQNKFACFSFQTLICPFIYLHSIRTVCFFGDASYSWSTFPQNKILLLSRNSFPKKGNWNRPTTSFWVPSEWKRNWMSVSARAYFVKFTN